MSDGFVWHGRRHWVQEPTGEQHAGWNTDFEGCPGFVPIIVFVPKVWRLYQKSKPEHAGLPNCPWGVFFQEPLTFLKAFLHTSFSPTRIPIS